MTAAAKPSNERRKAYRTIRQISTAPQKIVIFARKCAALLFRRSRPKANGNGHAEFVSNNAVNC